jgi:hypothetical protein
LTQRNSFGRVTTQTLPDGRVIETTYDANVKGDVGSESNVTSDQDWGSTLPSPATPASMAFRTFVQKLALMTTHHRVRAITGLQFSCVSGCRRQISRRADFGPEGPGTD